MATKPSPYTFINDTEGLPNTANVIYTQQNPNNTNTLVANYNDPTLFNNPQLQILNSAGGANGQLQFNNSRGFGGSSNLTYTESTSRLQLRGNLYVTGNLFANIQTNLNNFHLSGGANGYVLTTDGAGNVNWISPDPNTTASLYNGNSNVIVYANGNIAFSSNGVANVVTISNNGINLGSNANVRITGGNATNYLTTDGAGNLYWADDVPIYIGNSAPNLPQGHLWFDNDEGRAYINYDGNSWVDLSPAVMPNPDMYANTITFPDGSVQTTAGGGGGNNPFNQNLNTTNNVTFASVTATTGNLAQINGINPGSELVIQAGGSKNWNYGSNGILTLPFDNYLETTDVDLKAGSQGNVTIRANAAGNANLQSWIFDRTGNITFPDATKQRTAFTGSIAGANVTGVVANSTRAATVTTNAQPNITSVGTLTGLNLSGNLSTSGNITAANYIGNGSQLTGITVATVGTLANLSVTGNTRTGNLIVTSNTDSIGPSTGSIQTAGGIGAQGNIIGNNHLYIGPGASLTAFTNPVMIGKNTGQAYVQSAIINSADTGSTDWVAYGDNGTESGGWADFGFTSSNFSDPAYTVTGSNDGYFFVQPQSGSYGGNLVLATGNQGTVNDIIFATGGFQTGNIFGRIRHSNLTLEIPTGNISIGGNITANNLGNISSIDVDGNTSNILYGNGIFAAAPSINYGNSNVATLLGSFGSNNISTTGNITSDSLSGSNLFVTYSSGDEGGQISLAQAANSTLDGNTVTVDIYQNKFRIFEQGGNARGVYIDLLQSASSSTTLLNNRVSGFVNAGTFVTMDLLKATVTTSSNRGLSLAATTGSFSMRVAGTYANAAGTGGSMTFGTITTTPSASLFGWNFNGSGDMATYVITDSTNNRAYRITMQIGDLYDNNTICIERLV